MFKKFVLLCLLTSIFFLFTACDDSNTNPSGSELLGSWTMQTIQISVERIFGTPADTVTKNVSSNNYFLDFNNNKTFVGYIYDYSKGKNINNCGKFSINGNLLTFTDFNNKSYVFTYYCTNDTLILNQTKNISVPIIYITVKYSK